jgi:hypothetical protein
VHEYTRIFDGANGEFARMNTNFSGECVVRENSSKSGHYFIDSGSGSGFRQNQAASGIGYRAGQKSGKTQVELMPRGWKLAPAPLGTKDCHE